MIKDLHVAHLTGEATVIENKFVYDVIKLDRPRYTVGQMFFKPYESSKEFIFCARNTLWPLFMLGVSVLAPLTLPIAAGIMLTASASCLLFSGLSQCMNNDESASWWLDMSEQIFTTLCQAIINIIVLPLTALSLLTRSISTGLKAAVEIYESSASEAPLEDNLSDPTLRFP
jgi:hypothetical protein